MSRSVLCVVCVCVCVVLCVFFFFQAEDGIRDLVRSRGLGDVYKRQIIRNHSSMNCINQDDTTSSTRIWFQNDNRLVLFAHEEAVVGLSLIHI